MNKPYPPEIQKEISSAGCGGAVIGIAVGILISLSFVILAVHLNVAWH